MNTRIQLFTLVCVNLLLLTHVVAAKESFEQNLEKSFQVNSGGELVVHADRGSINVSTESTGNVHIKVFRKIDGGSKAKADEVFANHEVKFDQQGTTVIVEASTRNNHFWSNFRANFDVRYDISIPKQFNVELKTSGGNIKVADLDGQVVARTSSGAINLGNVTAKVDAADSGGNIRIESAGADLIAVTSSGSVGIGTVKGSAEVKNSGGDISISSVAGDVTAQTSSGSIRLGAAKGSRVTAKNSGGNIELESGDGAVFAETSSGTIKIGAVKAAVEARNSGGNIDIAQALSVRARTSSGMIKIGNVSGEVVAHNSGGDIRLGQAGGRTDVHTSSGRINIGSVTGKVEAGNSGGSIEIAQARDQVRAETSSGSLAVNFVSGLKEDSKLSVSGGGIKVGLPKGAALALDAKADGGRVASELPVAMTVRDDHERGGLRGKINGGGPLLILRSSSGDIVVKESAMELETQ